MKELILNLFRKKLFKETFGFIWNKLKEKGGLKWLIVIVAVVVAIEAGASLIGLEGVLTAVVDVQELTAFMLEDVCNSVAQ